MALSRLPAAAMQQTMRLLGTGPVAGMAIRQAAWVARCVGRGEVLFHCGTATEAVWIVQRGRVELSVGSGRRRSVVHVLQPGDVDGDIQHLLDMPLPYTGRALDECTVLSSTAADFEHLLADSQHIARRWLSSVAQRLAVSQARIIGLLGRSLTERVARLLLDESVEDAVPLPQRTLAAMLGVQHPSLNKILKEFERQGLVSRAGNAVTKSVDPGFCWQGADPPSYRVVLGWIGNAASRKLGRRISCLISGAGH